MKPPEVARQQLTMARQSSPLKQDDSEKRVSAGKEARISRRDFIKLSGAAMGGVLLAEGLVSVRAREAAALTPGMGQTIVGKSLVAPNFGSGTGITVNQDNVTIINPYLRGWAQGIKLVKKSDGRWPKNTRIVLDPNAAGYANAKIDRCSSGIVAPRADGLVVRSLATDRPFEIVDSYRPVTLHGGTNVLIDRLYTHGMYRWSGTSYDGAIVGVKVLADISYGPPYEIDNITVRGCVIRDVHEESLSNDPQNHNPSGAAVRDMDNVASTSAANSTINLASSYWLGKSGLHVGFYLVMHSGKANGKRLKILSQSGSAFHVEDPEGVISFISAGDRVIIGSPFSRITYDHNNVDASSGRVGIAYGGFTYDSSITDLSTDI